MVGDFGEIIWRFWRKTIWQFRRFGENLIGEIVVGDLEKLFGDFWRLPFGDFVLELVMEYRNAWRPYVEIEM